MGAVFRALAIPVDVRHLLPSVSQAGARRISQPPTPARAVVGDGHNLSLIRALVDRRTTPPSWRVRVGPRADIPPKTAFMSTPLTNSPLRPAGSGIFLKNPRSPGSG